jgi:hypothetical protein
MLSKQDAAALALLLTEAIHQAVDVNAQSGMLVVATNSQDKNLKFGIIAALEDLNSAEIKRVHVSGLGWSKLYIYKDGKFNEAKNLGFIVGVVVAALVGGLIAANIFFESVTSTSTTATGTNVGRVFLGYEPSGHQMWVDNSCVYVKDVRESELFRRKTTLDKLKQAVKKTTGYTCVLFD